MEFLKVLWNNLRKGPVTDPFPFGETFTPERLRGRVVIAPTCMGCGTCRHVCTAGAIKLRRREDGTGFEISVWQNTCCLCGQCRRYCPIGAVSIVNDWHTAHRNKEKFQRATHLSIDYDACERCGTRMRFMPMELLEKLYSGYPDMDAKTIGHLCPACRRLEFAEEEELGHHQHAAPAVLDDIPQEAPAPSQAEAADSASQDPQEEQQTGTTSASPERDQ